VKIIRIFDHSLPAPILLQAIITREAPLPLGRVCMQYGTESVHPKVPYMPLTYWTLDIMGSSFDEATKRNSVKYGNLESWLAARLDSVEWSGG
jgi:hypothetical protein